MKFVACDVNGPLRCQIFDINVEECCIRYLMSILKIVACEINDEVFIRYLTSLMKTVVSDVICPIICQISKIINEDCVLSDVNVEDYCICYQWSSDIRCQHEDCCVWCQWQRFYQTSDFIDENCCILCQQSIDSLDIWYLKLKIAESNVNSPLPVCISDI